MIGFHHSVGLYFPNVQLYCWINNLFANSQWLGVLSKRQFTLPRAAFSLNWKDLVFSFTLIKGFYYLKAKDSIALVEFFFQNAKKWA